MKRLIRTSPLAVLILCLSAFSASAQTEQLTDTLAAATTYATRFPVRSGDRISASVSDIQGTLSPLGEGDPIRWAQNLPGVTSGADGSSSFYVRGGNMGNNRISLDGVPLYGFSHLLGLTTTIPVSTIERAEFTKGGFDGRENNFTASRLNVISKAPSDSFRGSASLNTFLLGAECEGTITGNLSFLMSARVSPLAWEYRAVKSLLPETLSDLDSFRAKIGDVYGKLRYSIDDDSFVELAGLGSLDDYAFTVRQITDNSFGWNNGIASLRFHSQTGASTSDIAAYISHFKTGQMQNTVLRDKRNELTLQSGLLEMSLSADRNRMFRHFSAGYGGKARYALFNPGQVASVMNNCTAMLYDVYFQPEYTVVGKLQLKAVIRMNYYTLLNDSKGRFDPEFSFSSVYSASPNLSFEASFDRMVQYYHTLEGLPVGWSLDMIVPSDTEIKPETVTQGSFNLLFRRKVHRASIGGFYKHMDNLVYYKYAQNLFSGGMAEWKSQTDQGKGRSFGMECLYELNSNDWNLHLSYTLSKTDRYGFESINGGKPFNARFNRTHILQVQGGWRHLSISMLLESGHWENGAAQSYPMHILGGEEWRCDYYAGVNDYHMPTVFRLDAGYRWLFETGKTRHEINVGICNLTNHFNPFLLYFEGTTESWKELALLPIMPNIGYKLSF